MPIYTRYLRATGFALLLVSVASCSSDNDSAPVAGGAGRAGGRGGRGGGGAVPVVIAKVVEKSVPVTIPAVGTVEAISAVQLRAQITGQLGAIHFAEGQDVTKGQRLFSLDARPFQAALQQAQAVLARDSATAKNGEAQRVRSEDLFKRGLIARDEYETQTASAASLDATVAADQAAVETAKLNLQYTEIVAPLTGRTGALGVHVGDLIRANDTVPLIIINQLTPVYVGFSVPGRYLTEIRRFQARKALPVGVTLPSALAPGAAVAPDGEGATKGRGDAATTVGAPMEKGVVSFIDNAVDPTTGTIRLKGTFANSDRQLWPGTFVQVVLQLTTNADALVVPATAVQASQDGSYVYIVKADRTVEMRTITVERQVGDQMVISKGVAADEEVVTDGQLRLTPGARVTTGRGEGGGTGDRSGGAGRGGEGRGGDGQGQGRGDGARGRASGS